MGGVGDGLSSAGTVAVTSAEDDAAIDPVLTGAMESPRERVNVLKYEDAMVQFMKAGTKQQLLELSPSSSYHRLLLYRLAQRFGLEHASGEAEGGGVGMEPSMNRTLVLFKAPQSFMPRLLLIDTCGKKGTNDASGGRDGGAKAPVMRLMRRSRPAEGKQGGGRNILQCNGNGEEKFPSTANGCKSMTDREKAYAEARARIFGAPSESASSSSTSTSSAVSISSSSSCPLSGGGLKGGKGVQATGPDTLGGFGAGRGKFMAALSGDRRSSTPPQSSEQRQWLEDGQKRSGRGGGGEGDGDGGEGGGGGAKGEWSESKVLWRNREAEKSDPDFLRHPRPRGLPPGGGMMCAFSRGGGGGGGGMYGTMSGPPPAFNSLPPPPGAPPGAFYVDHYMQQQVMQQHMAAIYHHHHYHHQQQQQYHPHHQQAPFPSSSIFPQGYYNDPRYASYSYQGGGEGDGPERGGGIEERGMWGRGRGMGRGGIFVGRPLPSSHSRGGSSGNDTDQRCVEEDFPPLGR